MSEHAPLSPSSAAVWVVCNGYPKMTAAQPPQPETPASLEGTAAHWVASEYLKHGACSGAGESAPNGETITDEMIDGVMEYVDHVHRTLADCIKGHPVSLHVEERISIDTIHENNWGTPDAWAWRPVQHILDIWDFKYGHAPVDEFENWQLINYAAGILDSLDIDGRSDQTTIVNMHVVQPRCYAARGIARTWSVKASELRGYFNTLRLAAEKAMASDTINGALTCTVNPGCQYCPARHVCVTLQRSALRVADASQEALSLDLNATQTGNELKWLHAARDILNARISGLEESALAKIRRGEHVANYAVEVTAGRLKWDKPVDEVLMLGTLLGVNLGKPVEPITPTQAIKKLKIDESVIKQYSSRQSGAAKLVPADNSEARRIFAK